MKILKRGCLLLAMLMIGWVPVSPAFADKGSRNNARDVAELFVKSCLDNVDSPQKAADYAQGRFPPLPSEKAASFVNAVSPAGGRAWGKNYSRGSHVIVVGNDGICAVFASRADTPTLLLEVERAAEVIASRLHGAEVETRDDQSGSAPSLHKRFKIKRPESPTDIVVNVLPQSDPNYEAVIIAKAVGRIPGL